MSLNLWKNALLTIYSHRAKKRWKAVATDILMVAHGIKQAYLFDQWFSSPDELSRLLQLAWDHSLTNIQLDIVVVASGDILVFSREYLLKNHVTPKFVDVSWSRSEPTLIMDHEIVTDTMKSFSHFVDSVKDSCSTSKCQEHMSYYELETMDTANASSLFGLLLGYPWVYWFDCSEKDDNCLSMLPLRVYRVKGHFSECSWSSTPEESKNCDYPSDSKLQNCSNAKVENRDRSDGNVQNKKTKEQLKCFQTKETSHILFSFSVPEIILTDEADCGDVAESWFSEWKNSVPWIRLFSDVCLEKETVTLPCVTL